MSDAIDETCVVADAPANSLAAPVMAAFNGWWSGSDGETIRRDVLRATMSGDAGRMMEVLRNGMAQAWLSGAVEGVAAVRGEAL